MWPSRLLLLLVPLASPVLGQCVWDKDVDFPTIPPVMLDAGYNSILPVLEGSSRIVRVPTGSLVTLACSGNEIVNLGVTAADATCAGGTSLSISGTEWELKDLGCSDKPDEVIHRDVATCESGGALHSIGFETFDPNSYFDQIRVCFEPTIETTLYTEHVLHGANIAAKDIESSRPSFKSSSGFFSVSMNTVYAQDSQLALMTQLLGDEGLANTIIDPSQQLYFARGHMSPDADFTVVYEQDATYYYINALPQWQAFNNGNWKDLEYATRDLAIAHASDLRVYSGGYGVLQLDDINGNPVDIYLGLYEGSAVVPAPELTWKVVYEESSNKAAAVVGVNNPHLTTAPAPICSDICDQLSWIDFDTSDLYRGYTYCCTVDDLRAAIPHVPDLGSVGLLTN